MKNFISIDDDESRDEKIKKAILSNKMVIAAIFMLSISTVFIKSYYDERVEEYAKVSSNSEIGIMEGGYSSKNYSKLNSAGKYSVIDVISESSNLDKDEMLDILTSISSDDKILNDLISEKVSAILISKGLNDDALSYIQKIENKTGIIYSYLGDIYYMKGSYEKAIKHYRRASILSISREFKGLMEEKVFSINMKTMQAGDK